MSYEKELEQENELLRAEIVSLRQRVQDLQPHEDFHYAYLEAHQRWGRDPTAQEVEAQEEIGKLLVKLEKAQKKADEFEALKKVHNNLKSKVKANEVMTQQKSVKKDGFAVTIGNVIRAWMRS